MNEYTTMFGYDIDERIAAALRAGTSYERIYCELAARTRAVADLLVKQHIERQEAKCCD